MYRLSRKHNQNEFMAKAIKVVVTRCKECGATSEDRFLKKIKGTKEYICEYCDLEGDYEDEFEGKIAKSSAPDDEVDNEGIENDDVDYSENDVADSSDDDY